MPPTAFLRTHQHSPSSISVAKVQVSLPEHFMFAFFQLLREDPQDKLDLLHEILLTLTKVATILQLHSPMDHALVERLLMRSAIDYACPDDDFHYTIVFAVFAFFTR